MSMDGDTSKLLTQSEYARSRGVSQQAVSKAVKSGRIPTTSEGKIDPVVADASWRQNTRPRADVTPDLDARRSGKTRILEDNDDPNELRLDRPQATYTAARAVRELYLAKQAKLDYERSEERLVPAEDVLTEAFRAARAMRDQLMALPARLAPVLYAARTVAECHHLLEEALEAVSGGLDPESFAKLSKRKPRQRAAQ